MLDTMQETAPLQLAQIEIYFFLVHPIYKFVYLENAQKCKKKEKKEKGDRANRVTPSDPRINPPPSPFSPSFILEQNFD